MRYANEMGCCTPATSQPRGPQSSYTVVRASAWRKAQRGSSLCTQSFGSCKGEIAGIAVGAAVGGIVVLVAVGLILRTLLVRDAKPMFTCLEKAPAENNAPAVDKSAPAVDKNAPVDTNI